jgi:heat shock protein 5
LEASKIAKITPDNFRVTEVTPFSLGVAVNRDDESDIFSKVIDRFSPIPVSKSKIFNTTFDNQTEVRVAIYEGENRTCKENNYLGHFTITNVPPMPARQAKFEETFTIDSNGILTVTAADMQTGQQKFIQIDYGKGRLAGIETRN